MEIDYDTNITIMCKFHAQSVLNITNDCSCSIRYKTQFYKGTSHSGTVTLIIHPVKGEVQDFNITAANGTYTAIVEGKFNITGTATINFMHQLIYNNIMQALHLLKPMLS